MQLDRNWIAARIPHQGTMCLLDGVARWDEQSLCCTATSHRDKDNPLRSQGKLAAVCGIEYAAQAMAVHGALSGGRQERPRAGFLASVRGATVHVARLDDIEDALSVEVERISGDNNTILYSFVIRAAARTLLEGRAAVVTDADAIGHLAQI